MDDFKAFLDAAHERDLQVMIELVVNHTSDQHPWFQAARQAPPGSPERDFYVWSDTDRNTRTRASSSPTRRNPTGPGIPSSQGYYWHRFFSHQPDLNFDNPAVIEEVLKVMRYLARYGRGRDASRCDPVPGRARGHQLREPAGNARRHQDVCAAKWTPDIRIA